MNCLGLLLSKDQTLCPPRDKILAAPLPACQWQPSFVGLAVHYCGALEATGGVERRVPEMRRMVEFNCTLT